MTSIWLDEPYSPRPPLDGDTHADLCVVGAGIGGLATAWHALALGLSVQVVEARTVSSGATGRNGGFFIAGAAPMYHETVERWGRERAREIHAGTLAAQREMLEVAEAIGAARHFRPVGMLRLGVDAAEAADVRTHHAALAADAFPGELVAADALPEAVRREDRLGLYFPTDGAVHPARWLRALAAAVEARGARIAEGTRAVEVAPGRVRTDHGTVTCDHVVVAVDAGVEGWRGEVRSRRLNMLATAPAPARIPFPVYARYGYEYVQQLDDGRVALGGFSDLDADESWTDREEISDRVQARLDEYLRDELGVDASVTHRWVGLVGYTDDALPRAGAVGDRVWSLGGYSGTGHVQAWVAARHVTAAIATSVT